MRVKWIVLKIQQLVKQLSLLSIVTINMISCNFAGDEMFSDSYPTKLVDGVMYEVTGKVTRHLATYDTRLIFYIITAGCSLNFWISLLW